MGKYEQALRLHYRIVQRDPNNIHSIISSAEIYKQIGDLKKSRFWYRKALSLRPNMADFSLELAYISVALGDKSNAIKWFEKAKLDKPNDVRAINALGIYYKSLGEFEYAKREFNAAITSTPDNANAYSNVSDIVTVGSSDVFIDKTTRILDAQTKVSFETALWHFSLCRAYNTTKDKKKYLEHLVAGNNIMKNIKKFDIDNEKEKFTKILDRYSFFKISQKYQHSVNATRTPIFILGMPRSGTSLIEQILSAHSKVFGAGEMNTFNQLGKLFIQSTKVANQYDIDNWRHKYIESLSQANKDRPFVIDKLPQNFLFVGWIFTVFPEAKVIHVNRDARAVVWSNYKTFFPSQAFDYSYDIRNTVQYFQQYEGLMKKWYSYFPGKIFTLNYEKLTENLEEEVCKLLNFIGIDFEEACLKPENNSRRVSTASKLQVRKPIYANSSKAYQRYQDFLDPIFAEYKL